MQTKLHISAAVAAVIFPHAMPSEDALDRELISLQEAGIEEDTDGPRHGFQSVHSYIEWFSDGEDSRYENN